MGIPLKMNMIPVRIKQFAAVDYEEPSTLRDEDFDEPIYGTKKDYGAVLDIRAQVVYGTKERRDTALTGDPGKSAGHLTFRRSELDADAIILNKGDIVTKIGDFDVNYKLIEVRPSAHLRGKANIIMAFFVNNEETNPVIKR